MDDATKQAAEKAGLKDLDLLKLYDDDVPIEVALIDLKARFGHHATAFRQDTRIMPRAEYEAARASFLRDAERQDGKRREGAEMARAYGRFA